MKTVLFYPKIEKTFRPSYAPLGIMSIATYLNINGHNAIICDRFFSNESIDTVIKKHKPDIIGISVISQTFINDAIAISKAAKALNIPVIWGGCTASAIAKKVLESGLVDYVSFNEGEFTWLEIANAFDERQHFDDIKGLGYIKNGEYIRTEDREFIDLSILPSIDWSLIDPKQYMQKSYGFNKMLSTYSSKGCGGKCTYCYNTEFHKSKRRCRPIDQVINEMRFLVENYDADGFDFTDDLMFANRQEVLYFCNKLIESKLNICWSGYLSVGIVNNLEDYELMYKAGCRSMIYGIESGSEKILKSVNKRNVHLDKVKDTLALCVKAGIVPIAMFMLGFPGEDVEDIKKTIALAKELNGASVCFSFFTPLPGTKLYNDLINEKKIPLTTTLQEHAKTNELEELFSNFTNVPTIDLITIKNFIRLRGILTKTENSNSEQFMRVLLGTIKSWKGRGFFHFIKGMIYSAFSFLRTFTIFIHPKIRKKYGLYFTK